MEYLQKIEFKAKNGTLPSKMAHILEKFYYSYTQAVQQNNWTLTMVEPLLMKFLELVFSELEQPFVFEPFHQRITHPFDYYQFGLDFLRPLIIFNTSKVSSLERADQISAQLARKENVILLANHQTEPDPQAISLLLEKTHPQIAEEMIFVAGHRVISDPLAIPFSKGRNLLCIYSKKHIEYPPGKKQEKLLHNQRTMKKMSQLLSEGGKCIYVAPSGGRDRPNAQGTVSVAPFDPQSIEMFWLMAQQAERPTHFYPLALATHHLLPPPNSLEKDLSEKRHAQCTPIHLAFGPEVDMENFPGSQGLDKRTKRKVRAEHIWNLVRTDYEMINAK